MPSSDGIIEALRRVPALGLIALVAALPLSAAAAAKLAQTERLTLTLQFKSIPATLPVNRIPNAGAANAPMENEMGVSVDYTGDGRVDGVIRVGRNASGLFGVQPTPGQLNCLLSEVLSSTPSGLVTRDVAACTFRIQGPNLIVEVGPNTPPPINQLGPGSILYPFARFRWQESGGAVRETSDAANSLRLNAAGLDQAVSDPLDDLFGVCQSGCPSYLPDLNSFADIVAVSARIEAGVGSTAPVTFTATPSAAARGDPVQLSWSSGGTTSCLSTGGFGANGWVNGATLPTSGVRNVSIAPDAEIGSTINFVLTCSGPLGARQAQVGVRVLATSVAPNVRLEVLPDRLARSGPVRLRWQGRAVRECTLSGGPAGVALPTGVQPPEGEVTLNLAVPAVPTSTGFEIRCAGEFATVSSRTSLALGIAAGPNPQPQRAQASGVNGAPPNGPSAAPAVADQGRAIAFVSEASNLIGGDRNGRPDVYLRDALSGAIERISLAADGSEFADRTSIQPRISRDGRRIVYTNAADLSGEQAIDGRICVRERSAAGSRCISDAAPGVAGNGSSRHPDISGDGRYVVFESTSSNLVPEDDNAQVDVYLRDLESDGLRVLSRNGAGQIGDAGSGRPRLDCRGRVAVFESRAGNFDGPIAPGVQNVYLASLVGSAGPRLISRAPNGAANGDSGRPVVSADGRWVVFESIASNLVTDDRNGVSDVFLADTLTGELRRLSVAASGVEGNGPSGRPSISCDGLYIAFESEASNLVPNDGNGLSDVFVLDRVSGARVRASQSVLGDDANGRSTGPSFSADGTALGFTSDAPLIGAGFGIRNALVGVNPFSTRDYTGAWYDPGQSGHGLLINQLQDGRLLVYWFTYDRSGALAWFGGTGPLQGTQALISVHRAQGPGGRFLPNFDPERISQTAIGTLSLRFESCERGRVDFALDAEFGSGSMALDRLTTPQHVRCGAGAVPTGDPKRIVAKNLPRTDTVTGAWFDPAQPGQGLFLEALQDGRVHANWFTFLPDGGQAWFGGVGAVTAQGRWVVPVTRTRGVRWTPSNLVGFPIRTQIGTLNIDFASCQEARVEYDLSAGGFGIGAMPLRRLAELQGQICP